MVRHVKITPYRFALVRPRRTSNGPKQSTPVNENGGFSGVVRSGGRLAIFCLAAGACRFLQLTQPFNTFRTVDLALIIQNLSRIKDNVYSKPE
jgi:hypothetical protein